MTREIQVGDIVRDRSVDGLVAEWNEARLRTFEVMGVRPAVDPLSHGPYSIASENAGLRVQLRVSLRPLGHGFPATARVTARSAYNGHGDVFEVVKTVEERMAEELMS